MKITIDPTLGDKTARLARAAAELGTSPRAAPAPRWAEALGPMDRATLEKLQAGQAVERGEIEAAYRAFVAAGGSPATMGEGLTRLGIQKVGHLFGGETSLGGGAVSGWVALTEKIDWAKLGLSITGNGSMTMASTAVGDYVNLMLLGGKEWPLPGGETLKAGAEIELSPAWAERHPALIGKRLELTHFARHPLAQYLNARAQGLSHDQIVVGEMGVKGGPNIPFSMADLEHIKVL